MSYYKFMRFNNRKHRDIIIDKLLNNLGFEEDWDFNLYDDELIVTIHDNELSCGFELCSLYAFTEDPDYTEIKIKDL